MSGFIRPALSMSGSDGGFNRAKKLAELIKNKDAAHARSLSICSTGAIDTRSEGIGKTKMSKS